MLIPISYDLLVFFPQFFNSSFSRFFSQVIYQQLNFIDGSFIPLFSHDQDSNSKADCTTDISRHQTFDSIGCWLNNFIFQCYAILVCPTIRKWAPTGLSFMQYLVVFYIRVGFDFCLGGDYLVVYLACLLWMVCW